MSAASVFSLLLPAVEQVEPFNYEMRNEYYCAISFDDGGKANLGFYADQGGALPDSEEGSMWLVLYLEDEALWFS